MIEMQNTTITMNGMCYLSFISYFILGLTGDKVESPAVHHSKKPKKGAFIFGGRMVHVPSNAQTKHNSGKTSIFYHYIYILQSVILDIVSQCIFYVLDTPSFRSLNMYTLRIVWRVDNVKGKIFK